MPRVKIARKSTAIDMTAMCDVAFLLLTFFILTAKPKIDDPSKADTPASSTEMTIPEDNTLIISIGKTANGADVGPNGAANKIFLSIAGTDIRQEVLKTMGDQYKVSFTPAEINKFANTEVFGVPMSQLKQFLDMDAQDLKNFDQKGIPVDTLTNNELSNWILNSRKADRGLHGKDMQLIIKGDRGKQYPAINAIISTLGRQKVFKFQLITALKMAPKK